MDKKILDNFYEYLKDVIKHYQETGGLRNFSPLAKKWGVKAITKDLFYMYELHKIEKGSTISRFQSDCIRKSISEKDKIRRSKFGNGDVVVWNRNGFRSVAVIDDGLMFSVCLNYRSREDEQDRVWYYDGIPTDVKIEKAKEEDMKSLISALIKQDLGLFSVLK